MTACPSCNATDIAVLPEASFEGFWNQRVGKKDSLGNGHLRVAVHMCMACGNIRFFANDPAAQLAEFGPTVIRR
jgi:hypothetical protein